MTAEEIKEGSRVTGKVYTGWSGSMDIPGLKHYLARAHHESWGILLCEVDPDTYVPVKGGRETWVSENAIGRTFHRARTVPPTTPPRILRLSGAGLKERETARVCTVAEFCALDGPGGPDTALIVRSLTVGRSITFGNGIEVRLLPVWELAWDHPLNLPAEANL